MIQFMAALGVAARVPGCRLSNVRLPEWGVTSPDIAETGERTERITGIGMRIDVAEVSERLRSGVMSRFSIDGYAQHMDNFLERGVYNGIFRQRGIEAEAIGPDCLAISIRGSEVLAAPHQDYTLIPIAFYREIVATTGLQPVFIGQIGMDPYSDALRQAFPTARFIPSRGALHDFELLRRATNLVVSVSTFAWLAAWLSEASLIVLPLTGFLNPCQFPQVDLLPLNDSRYRFYLFPLNYAVPVEQVALLHETMAGCWRRMMPSMIAELRAHRPRFGLDLPAMYPYFDEGFYLATNVDVAQAVERGGFRNGFDHWLMAGCHERRAPFPLHKIWYGMTYPLAAIEVGQGDFADFHHHWVAVGRQRGYRTLPLQAGSSSP
ncbi:MAG: hypothetical protein M3Y41_18680 [Pseudomonadota bacterium]|nr:hypothetical protein [Pseudomonadota bacterium]